MFGGLGFKALRGFRVWGFSVQAFLKQNNGCCQGAFGCYVRNLRATTALACYQALFRKLIAHVRLCP